ncbi:putative 3-hexulose-6-phosphate isomerase [Methanocella paludicola SANAE]|uniref:3-hexulose-6-phosphate isomerase n=1 Tax=Methanocella paludicola (strain DSM 17711 / JCM 13418 / NBRC 101707 / SANAE) TaxID=304371 RepID=D1Z027_METPS|nr:sugar phosphate isomerase [Methanocella paludicola]BAI62049.1 putative 3-hexulose-6-phosphate isomerase [Methanocella paludicola SANAE]
MSSTDLFYDSVKIQQQFIGQLEEVKKGKILEFINLLAGFILDDTKHTKVIYGIAEGRSALALYDFLQQSSMYENIYPVTLDDPIRRYIDPGKENLVIAATGSGETKGVLRYLEDAFTQKVPVVLITANVNSRAYNMVSSYENGYIFDIEPLKGISNKNLAALGSEFELKLSVLLNAVIPELYHHDPGKDADKYYLTLEHVMKNAGLLLNIDSAHLDEWSDKVLNRRGNYVVDGVSRSGFVANAFGMRLTHLGRNVFMRDGPTTPAFLRGDAYLPITGSGNTREIIEGAIKAKLHGADVFPITVNYNSKLTSLMESWGYSKNIMFVPVEQTDINMYREKEASKIVATKSVQTRPSISELNSYIFTNAFIALGIDMLGVSEKYLAQKHV